MPLERVAEIGLGMGPTSIERYNQNRRVFVSADLAPGTARGDVTSAISNLPIMQNLPTGVANTPVGQDEWQSQLVDSFGVALLLAWQRDNSQAFLRMVGLAFLLHAGLPPAYIALSAPEPWLLPPSEV